MSACRAGTLRTWSLTNSSFLGETQAHVGPINSICTNAASLVFTASTYDYYRHCLLFGFYYASILLLVLFWSGFFKFCFFLSCFYSAFNMLLFCFCPAIMLFLFGFYSTSICFYSTSILLLFCFYSASILLLFCFYFDSSLLLFLFYLLLFCFCSAFILLLFWFYSSSILLFMLQVS